MKCLQLFADVHIAINFITPISTKSEIVFRRPVFHPEIEQEDIKIIKSQMLPCLSND